MCYPCKKSEEQAGDETLNKKQESPSPARYAPGAAVGLTDAQVEKRRRDGLLNTDPTTPTKSVGRIIRDNICTLFNLVITLLGVAVLAVGSYKNLLFLGIMLCNILIGIVQELHTKRAIDKLSILSAVKVRAVRGGKTTELGVDEIVLDDVLELARGNQIACDCILLEGECDVNESLITGESDAIHKMAGDMLLSGSFVVNGSCRARVEHIGEDNYVAHISSGAKRYKKTRSEIMESLQKIIRIVSIIMIPVGICLFITQFTIDGMSLQRAVVSTTAALIGMIPEGLVLLTSSVLAVGVVRLARYKVMVQELYCIEALARVDVLCLDKTGTLTEGRMELREALPLDGTSAREIGQALAALAAVMREDSPSIEAIAQAYPQSPGWSPRRVVRFSSEKKWSGACFENAGCYVLGAPDRVLPGMDAALRLRVQEYARESRALLLARAGGEFPADGGLPSGLTPMALILLQDRIRPDAADTLRYFREADVAIKVISGDDPVTVSAIARRVGLSGADEYIDATLLDSEESIREAMEKYTVFGRVSPQQKKQMVLALQEKKHTVAMTGDGVNDVLALKEADCSVAMASGSDAARNVAQLVLLDSQFSSMPQVVAEGRRSINNLQRSASLFIVKTIFSIVLSLLFLLIRQPYPFSPIQLTLISSLTIGLPSFVLALEPNKERIRGKFIRNVFVNAAPAALTIIFHVTAWSLLCPALHIEHLQTSTLCVISAAFTGLMLNYTLCQPWNLIRRLLFGVITAGLTIAVVFLPSFFSLSTFSLPLLLMTAGTMLTCLLLFLLLNRLFAPLRTPLKQRLAARQK